MHFSCDLLNQSVEHAGRSVALELLDAAAEARKRLDDPDDAEALHDFRVAVRRLRTWLRALRPWLGDGTPKKARRRLKKTARLTGKSRDAEVHLEWLEGQRSHLSSTERRGHALIMEQIEEEKRKGDHRVATAGTRAFDRSHTTLSRKLRSYRVAVDDGEADTPHSFPAEMAELIRAQGAKLSECLAGVRTFKDVEEGHQARIAGKRLRYLIEAVADCVSGAERVVTDLGELQDLLGDWHDAHVFSAAIASAGAGKSSAQGRDTRSGLDALAKRLQKRGRKAFRSVKDRWCDTGALQPQVDAIVEELSAHGGQTTEIERKYLLAGLPTLPNDAPVVEIEQGYIPGKRLQERLRRVRIATNERRYLRTLKSGDGLARMEIEEAVPKTLFNRMWPLTEGRRLRKRRYSVPDDGHTWEVDEFLDRDLVLAEVELHSSDEEVEIPSWLASVVVRDVTGESEFSNSSLASGQILPADSRAPRRERSQIKAEIKTYADRIE